MCVVDVYICILMYMYAHKYFYNINAQVSAKCRSQCRYTYIHKYLEYGVATINMLLEIIVSYAKSPIKETLFCQRDSIYTHKSALTADTWVMYTYTYTHIHMYICECVLMYIYWAAISADWQAWPRAAPALPAHSAPPWASCSCSTQRTPRDRLCSSPRPVDTYESVIRRMRHEWVMSHIWMSHVKHMNEWCHAYEWVMSHKWMSHVTYMNESCHTNEWVMAHMNQSCHTYQ